MSKSTSCPARPAKLIAVALASLFVATSAGAQSRAARPASTDTNNPAVAAAPAGKGSLTITYKQRTNYDFDEDQVEGDVVRPDGGLITVRLRAGHESMVVLRADFRPELLKSVETL